MIPKKSIPTLYLLDICTIDLIKRSKNTKFLDNSPRKKSLCKKLKALDYSHNGFSSILALMEKLSSTRGKLSPEELKQNLLQDCSFLYEFFSYAKVLESEHLVNLAFEKLYGDPIEGNKSSYLCFLKFLNNELKLYNNIANKQKLNKAIEAINKAKELSIPSQHPIVVLALGAIYGNNDVKTFMKFKEKPENFLVENVLSDIMNISRIADITMMITQEKLYQKVSFITDDGALEKVLEYFTNVNVSYQKHQNGINKSFTLKVKLAELLTLSVQDNEYDEILNLLT